MPEDRVGRGGVEIEVRQREVHQVVLPLEGHRLAADRQRHVARFRAVEVGGLEALNIGRDLGDPRLELGNRLFRVLVLGDFLSGEARHRALGEVGDQLHLAGQREHVRRQAIVEQHRRIDLLLGREGFRLGEHAVDGLQGLKESRHGRLVHGKGLIRVSINNRRVLF